MYICVDFDGTCVSHEFPRIGNDIGAVPVLRRLVEAGHKLILFTMRSSEEIVEVDTPNIYKTFNALHEAVAWFKANDIPLFGIQCNPMQKSFTNSPKAYGELFIDDAALGCPLKVNSEISGYPFVDWIAVEQKLEDLKILPRLSGKVDGLDLSELISKVHESMEGRYNLSGFDLYNLSFFLCKLQ